MWPQWNLFALLIASYSRSGGSAAAGDSARKVAIRESIPPNVRSCALPGEFSLNGLDRARPGVRRGWGIRVESSQAPEGRKNLSHTYTNLLAHVIFSTKDRAPLITAALLLAYLGRIMRELGGTPKRMDDHRRKKATVRASPPFARAVAAGDGFYGWGRSSTLAALDAAWASKACWYSASGNTSIRSFPKPICGRRLTARSCV